MFSATFMCGNSAPRWKTMFVGRRWGGHVGDVQAPDADAPAGGSLEAGDDAQQRRLAAAARAQQRDELVLARSRRSMPLQRDRGRRSASRRPTISTAGRRHAVTAPPARARLERTTRTTSETSTIVASALMEGSTPRRMRPQMSDRQRGLVADVEPGDHELVERQGHRQQRRADDRRPDEREGDVPERAQRARRPGRGPPRAPRSRRSRGGRSRSGPRTAAPTRMWPIAALTSPGGCTSAEKRTASAMPMTSAGTVAGSRLAVSSGPRRRRSSRASPKAKGTPRSTDRDERSRPPAGRC